MEIERKYLPLDLPRDLESYPHKRLTQGYISRDPVIRVRSIETLDGSGQADRYVLTVKSSGLAVHQEYELDLTRSQFDSLSEKGEGHLISKVRYVIPLDNGLKAELDLFESGCRIPGLRMVEVEFPSVEAMNAFRPPAWFGKDVTEDYHYHNSNLSL